MTDTATRDPGPVEGSWWTPLAAFTAHIKGWGGDRQSSALLLHLAVDEDNKYEAMPITDKEGRRLRVTVDVLEFDGYDDEAES